MALGASSALSIATLALEIQRTGNASYRFLVWNLFLAWIPVAAALAATGAARRGAGAAALLCGLVWVLFFPNAPYMLTDYIHLAERGYASAPIWYDALMLSAFVWTALLLGFFSLYLMQRLWAPLFGPVGEWVAVFLAFALASFGVYLGRFVHINSWDALVRPRRIAHIVARQFDNPLTHPALFATMTVITLFLVVAYWSIYSFGGLRTTPTGADQEPDQATANGNSALPLLTGSAAERRRR
jgi:uncharacterized membrane protein